MQHFARELFLLARQCGAARLSDEARMLFNQARSASTPERRRGMDFIAYRAAVGVLGWSLAGRITCGLDDLRRGGHLGTLRRHQHLVRENPAES
jgi:hypothetical protein